MVQTIIAFVAGAILAEPAAKLLRPVVKEAAKGGAILTHKVVDLTSGARAAVVGAAAAAATGLRESDLAQAVDEGIAAAKKSESKPKASKASSKKRATKTAPA